MALRQLGAVGAVDQRDVGERRDRPPQGREQLCLSGGVGQVVDPADHVGDAHVVVVRHDREHVGGRAVAAEQHHVVELLRGEPHVALHEIRDDGLAVQRRAEAHRRIDPGRCVGGAAVAAAAVVADRPSGGARRVALFGELRGGAPAAVRFTFRQQTFGEFPMTLCAAGLEQRLAVPVQAQPSQSAEDCLHRACGRAVAVGVLDAQPEPSPGVPRVQPVEQRGAGAADVQESGRRRSEAGDDHAASCQYFMKRTILVPLAGPHSRLCLYRTPRRSPRNRMRRPC